jgi:hypothetical protein
MKLPKINKLYLYKTDNETFRCTVTSYDGRNVWLTVKDERGRSNKEVWELTLFHSRFK